MFLPIINSNSLQTRSYDLLQISPSNKTINISIMYTPITFGQLRLILHFEEALQNLKTLGFSDKDIDEMKELLVDTNIYILGGIILVAAIHVRV